MQPTPPGRPSQPPTPHSTANQPRQLSNPVLPPQPPPQAPCHSSRCRNCCHSHDRHCHVTCARAPSYAWFHVQRGLMMMLPLRRCCHYTCQCRSAETPVCHPYCCCQHAGTAAVAPAAVPAAAAAAVLLAAEIAARQLTPHPGSLPAQTPVHPAVVAVQESRAQYVADCIPAAADSACCCLVNQPTPPEAVASQQHYLLPLPPPEPAPSLFHQLAHSPGMQLVLLLLTHPSHPHSLQEPIQQKPTILLQVPPSLPWPGQRAVSVQGAGEACPAMEKRLFANLQTRVRILAREWSRLKCCFPRRNCCQGHHKMMRNRPALSAALVLTAVPAAPAMCEQRQLVDSAGFTMVSM